MVVPVDLGEGYARAGNHESVECLNLEDELAILIHLLITNYMLTHIVMQVNIRPITSYMYIVA